MKKTLIVLLAFVMLMLSACGQNAAPQSGSSNEPSEPSAASVADSAPAASESSTEPAEPAETEAEPETQPGTARLLRLCAVLDTLKRGDTVQIIGEPKAGYEDYLIVMAGDSYGLVEKQFLKLEGDAEPVSWTAYTQKKAELHSTYLLNDASPLSVPVNTQLKVIDEFDGCCLVEYNGGSYTVARSAIGSGRYTPPSENDDDSSNDGGDIHLNLALFIKPEGESIGSATVRLDGTPLIIGIYDRNEEVRVISREGEVCSLLVYGMQAYTEARFVRADGEKAYEGWNGYSAPGARLYDNPWLVGSGAQLGLNSALEVLDDLGDCYMVSCGSGSGYIAKNSVTTQKTGTGNGSDSASDGWTEPVL